MSKTQNSQVSKPNRPRLTPKQRAFLHHVYDLGISITDALNMLQVRTVTFQRWLNKPVFINRLRMYITQYYLQARLEMARSAPAAIAGLNLLNEKSIRPEEKRKACNDILNIHTQFAKIASGSKPAQKGDAVDNFGALLAQFGAFMEHKGAVLPAPNTQNNTKIHIIEAENAV